MMMRSRRKESTVPWWRAKAATNKEEGEGSGRIKSSSSAGITFTTTTTNAGRDDVETANANIVLPQSLQREQPSIFPKQHPRNKKRHATSAASLVLVAVLILIFSVIIFLGYNLHIMHLDNSSGSSASDVHRMFGGKKTINLVHRNNPRNFELGEEKYSLIDAEDKVGSEVNVGKYVEEADKGDMALEGEATLAVLVSGAGSSEVNGCYLYKDMSGNAWEFELDNTATGRTFEMFKGEGSGWWNIQERVGDSHPNHVHYGVEGDSDDVLPPRDGWGSIEYKESWLGMDPMPKVEVTTKKACQQDKVEKLMEHHRIQKPEESLLVLMNVKIQDKQDIAKEMRWIQEDYYAVCNFYSTCQWMVNVVIANQALVSSFHEASSKLPLLNITFRTTVSTVTFNKYIFIQGFVDQMIDYDLLLLKDNDQRIISFSWHTFIEKRSNAVTSGPLRRSTDCTDKRQWFQFHESCYYESPTRPEWSSTLLEQVVPIEVPYLEQYFVLMDAKFANFFFNIVLRPKLVNKVSDGVIDLAWCAAARSWDSSRPACHLVPVVSYHEDTRQINKNEEFEDAGFVADSTYEADPLVVRWLEASSKWAELIGWRKDLREIEQECRGLLSLDAADSFDLQACATRAGGGIIHSVGTEEGYETLKLIMNEINKSKAKPDKNVQMLNEAKRSLTDSLHQID